MTEFQKLVEELGGKAELHDGKKPAERGPGKPMDRGIVVEFANGLRLEAGFRFIDGGGEMEGFFVARPRTDEEIWKDAEWDLAEHYEAWYDKRGFVVENPVGEDYSSLSEFRLRAYASGVFAA